MVVRCEVETSTVREFKEESIDDRLSIEIEYFRQYSLNFPPFPGLEGETPAELGAHKIDISGVTSQIPPER